MHQMHETSCETRSATFMNSLNVPVTTLENLAHFLTFPVLHVPLCILENSIIPITCRICVFP